MRTSLIFALGLILSLAITTSAQYEVESQPMNYKRCKELVRNDAMDDDDRDDEEDQNAQRKNKQVSRRRKLFRFNKNKGRCGIQLDDIKGNAASVFNLPKKLKSTQILTLSISFCAETYQSYEYYRAVRESLRVRIKKTKNGVTRRILRIQLKQVESKYKKVSRSKKVLRFQKQMKIDALQHAKSVAKQLLQNSQGLNRNAVRKLVRNVNFVKRMAKISRYDEIQHVLAKDYVRCVRKLKLKNISKLERSIFKTVLDGVKIQLRSIRRKTKKESAFFIGVLGKRAYLRFRSKTNFYYHEVKVVKTRKVVKKTVVRRG